MLWQLSTLRMKVSFGGEDAHVPALGLMRHGTKHKSGGDLAYLL